MNGRIVKNEFTFGVLNNIDGSLCALCGELATGELYDAYPSPECLACDECASQAVKTGQIIYPSK